MLDRFDEKIRVGFVMHKMEVAGAEVLVKQIIDRLKSRIEPTVLCLDGIGELGRQLLESSVPVVSLNRKPGVDWLVGKKIADEVKNRRIEVLHAHQYTPFFYSAVARIRHRAKSRVIFTEHGRAYPDVVSWKRKLVNRFCLQRYANQITACCDFSTCALQKKDGFPHAKTLRNGVEIGDFVPRGTPDDVQRQRKALGLKADGLYVACVARMHPIKDHATLIRSWKIVQKSVPSAKLLLVGDGPERANIERQIEDAMLRGSVELLGVRHDVKDILRAVNVSTLTSVSEAASLTLLEAMASQCPSVVTDVGGNAELLREGVDGFLVPRGDATVLARRLVELLSDFALQHQFGSAARQRVAENFSLGQAIAAYMSHYENLAQRSASLNRLEPALVDG